MAWVHDQRSRPSCIGNGDSLRSNKQGEGDQTMRMCFSHGFVKTAWSLGPPHHQGQMEYSERAPKGISSALPTSRADEPLTSISSQRAQQHE